MVIRQVTVLCCLPASSIRFSIENELGDDKQIVMVFIAGIIYPPGELGLVLK